MTRPRLLDLFCGAGGCSVGYRRAGFDVIGIDNEPHPDYPFTFMLADALDVLDALATRGELGGRRIDVIHASPPCQAYSNLRHLSDRQHPDLIGPVRDLLRRWGGLYVIENVEGAPLIGALRLCGSEFDLWADCADGIRRQLRRHRLFESNAFLMGAGGCLHYGQPVGVYGHGGGGGMTRGYKGDLAESRQATGAWWMNRSDVSQCVPPAYTEFVGGQLIEELARVVT